jgi:hypothetical protein
MIATSETARVRHVELDALVGDAYSDVGMKSLWGGARRIAEITAVWHRYLDDQGRFGIMV